MVPTGVLCKSQVVKGRTELLYDGERSIGNDLFRNKVPSLPVGESIYLTTARRLAEHLLRCFQEGRLEETEVRLREENRRLRDWNSELEGQLL